MQHTNPYILPIVSTATNEATTTINTATNEATATTNEITDVSASCSTYTVNRNENSKFSSLLMNLSDKNVEKSKHYNLSDVIQLQEAFNEIGNHAKEFIQNGNLTKVTAELRNRCGKSQAYLHNCTALFEVLRLNTQFTINRIFLDIENIPLDKPNLIADLVKDFVEILKKIPEIHVTHTADLLNKKIYGYSPTEMSVFTGDVVLVPSEKRDYSYVVTFNRHSSSHAGLSYHVIFTHLYFYNLYVIKQLMVKFLNEKRCYTKYVDTSIYSSYRLFRLPYSKNVKNTTTTARIINIDDIHYPYDIKQHRIIEIINPEDYLISLSYNPVTTHATTQTATHATTHATTQTIKPIDCLVCGSYLYEHNYNKRKYDILKRGHFSCNISDKDARMIKKLLDKIVAKSEITAKEMEECKNLLNFLNGRDNDEDNE